MAGSNAIKSVEQPAALFVCIALAFIFWMLITLSKEQETERTLKLSYFNQPSDQVLVNKLPATLTIEYSGPGWGLLSDYFRRREIKIDLARYRSNSLLLTNYNHDLFEEQFPNGFEVLHVSPDTIFMKFEKAASKRLAVKLDTDLHFEGSYGSTKQAVCEPDSISITGPASLLDTLDFWSSETVHLTGLKGDVTGEIALKAIPSNLNLQLSTTQVQYNVLVAEFTEGKIDVPILLPKGDSSLRLMTRTALVRFQIPLEDYDQVDENSFEIAASPPEEDGSLLSIRLTKYPPTARNLRFSPEKVEYFYIK